MFFWSKERRRARVRERPFPETWAEILRRRVPYYTRLPEAQQAELRGHVQVFLAEKHFEGCGGFALNDDVRVTIAGHACILLLNRPAHYYPKLTSILVYEDQFWVNAHVEDDDGLVEEVDDWHAGESWQTGAVILAWKEVLDCGAVEGEAAYNVVLHEFAHQLDDDDGVIDGVPSLDRENLFDRWADVFERSFEKHLRDVRRRRDTPIDDYGAEDPAEFFAVATETFFEMPAALRKRHPELYELLRGYYRQDPAKYA